MRTSGRMPGIQTEQHHIVIHYFPDDFMIEGPHGFTDPFRYVPHAAVQQAAIQVINGIKSAPDLAAAFDEGKMLGILVCRTASGRLCYLSAFSGNIGGQSHITGFVPPIYDLLDPKGHFKRKEAEITAINKEIKTLSESSELACWRDEFKILTESRDKEIESFRNRMADNKKQRASIRSGTDNPETLASLIKESQHEKAEFKRLKLLWDEKINKVATRIKGFNAQIEALSSRRSQMSDQLQDWIFRQYIVHNFTGGETSIADLFNSQGLVPPGGTGECAAPKLLEYAYRNSLEPLAMGEFWYGRSPETAVRTHGHFYPSCTSKCGPLLAYMMKGLSISHCDTTNIPTPAVIYEDETIIVVEKPSGMPSVPGLDGRKSLLEWLQNALRPSPVSSVHRLDMDTSGVMIYAKTEQASVHLQRQFEEHSVQKTYMARVKVDHETIVAKEGKIDLALSPDYDERPRQKVDIRHGKYAYTEYEAINYNPDGTTDLLLRPFTGRTHQLRVHCAHSLGLGAPIVGDMLYGGYGIGNNDTPLRLNLHALSISFNHPATDERLHFTSKEFIY